MKNFLYQSLSGFSFYNAVFFSATIITTIIIDKLIASYFVSLAKMSEKKYGSLISKGLIEAIKGPIKAIIFTTGAYFALLSLHISDKRFPVTTFITQVKDVAIIFIIIKGFFKLIDALDEGLKDKTSKKKAKKSFIGHFSPLFNRTAKLITLLVGIIVLMQYFGYSASSLIAGFGIAGAAVGFAAKESIAGIFSSVSLVADKTYKVGDWVVVDKFIKNESVEGIVEDITIRSTKIRAFDDTLIHVPNNQLANSIIKNGSALNKRRVLEFIDITYDTPPEMIEKAIDVCKHIILSTDNTDDFYKVSLSQVGPYSFKIMIYFYVKTTDWGEYLSTKQNVFLSIIREFKNAGIKLAFPSQALYFNQEESEIKF